MTRITFPLAFGLALMAAGCSQPASQQQAAETPAAPAANVAAASEPDVGPPALWTAEAKDASGAVKTTFVCTDSTIRAAFARSLPSPDGQTCALIGRPVTEQGWFSARCRVNDVEFTARSTVQGDIAQDFTVNTTITADGPKPSEFSQTSQFRKVGACPADWEVGDSAPAGATQVVNVLSGKTRTASAISR